MAILELEVMHVDEEKRDTILNQVICEQGPPDGTVVVSMTTEEELDDEMVDELLGLFGDIGDIILVRSVGSASKGFIIEM